MTTAAGAVLAGEQVLDRFDQRAGAGFELQQGLFQGLLAVGFVTPFLEDQQPGQDTVHMHLGRIFFGERQHHVLQRGLGRGIADVAFAAAR